MDITELLGLITKDKSITINVQTGDGAKQYNGVTQINHYPAQRQIDAPHQIGARRSEWTYYCESCGYTSHIRSEFVSYGRGRLYLCLDCERESKRAAPSAPELPQIEAPAPAAPPAIVIDTKQLEFDARYREMQAARAAYLDAEFDLINRNRK